MLAVKFHNNYYMFNFTATNDALKNVKYYGLHNIHYYLFLCKNCLQ